MEGCDSFVHHLETETLFLPMFPDSSALVIPISANTALILLYFFLPKRLNYS